MSAQTSHIQVQSAAQPCAAEQQGRTLISRLQFAAAASALQRALSVCPDRAQVRLELANAQMLGHEFHAALLTLHPLLVQRPANTAALLEEARILYLLNKDAAAESALMQAVREAPRNPLPHYLLGRIYYQDSHAHRAAAQFKDALDLAPDDYRALDGLALSYENMGQVGPAVQTFMKGLALVATAHPHYDVIYADFAEFLLHYGENAKAFALASDAASRNPRTARDYFLAGKALAQEGQVARSERWLQRAVKLDPAYPAPHYLLARLYRRQGDNTRAQQESRTFAKLLAAAPQVRR